MREYLNAQFMASLPEAFRKLQADFAALKAEHEALKEYVYAKKTKPAKPPAAPPEPQTVPPKPHLAASSFSSGFQIGRVMHFGKHEWYIIGIGDDRLTLLSKNVLYQKPFNNQRRDIMWVNCDLRLWLTKEFCRREFGSAEKKRLLQATCENADNREYGTPGGKETIDHVYLLSHDEAKRLLEHPFGKDILFSRTDWWLRSPGRSKENAMIVHDGSIFTAGRTVDTPHGVRPVITIDLLP